MTATVAFPDGACITFSALTVTRSLEAAYSQVSLATFEDLAPRVDDIIDVKDAQGETRFRGYLERNDGSSTTGFSANAQSLAIQLDRFDARGSEAFRRTNLEAVVRALAQVAGAEVGRIPRRRVTRFRLRRGETFRQAVQRLAEAHQIVVTDDRMGRIQAFALPSGPLVPVATWTDGRGTVTEPIARRLDYSQWRREWLCRGQRLLVASDAGGGNQETIAIASQVANTRPSRRVLSNKAASSKADAAALIDWAAKKQLAQTIGVSVVHGEWPGEPGDVVRVRSRALGIDDVLIVEGLEADLVRNRYTARCVFPDVYRERVKLRRERATRPRQWGPA